MTFPGETPPPAMFANRDERNCPHGIAQNHLEVRQQNLGLRNALIILEAKEVREVRSRRATLRVRGCVFLPRVQWVPLGTSLQLVNEDKAEHQIHAFLKEASVFDVLLSPGQIGQSRTPHRPIVQPGFYKINCDRHPWERAWIYASAHPYVAVTDASGHFQIKDVPRGSYSLRVWHEGWQERTKDSQERLEYFPVGQTQSITVKENEISTIRFDDLKPAWDVR
ncbi:MAG: carboxypeptidase regulatory-like domain-containing protein [Elusimicrobiota bacterium]